MSSNRDTVISVRNLTKVYKIPHNAASHTTLQEALLHKLRNPLFKPAVEEFMAVQDVSFDVQSGDAVGIVGRNGAGKSTLLKLLSRITAPTAGEIRMRGRVGSLLEVGTGFHPELTGRENIFLNGSILGMNHREIARQFDAIVDFSGTERFLDTPIKRYSSGMTVRLAFAVAAHLDPEILIVDEVLAVGDAEFQKKCLGKMQDVTKGGRTILFVSHNMGAVSSLCSRAIFLEHGQLRMIDTVDRVISTYLASADSYEGEQRWLDVSTAPGDERVRLRAVRILNVDGQISAAVDMHQPMEVQIEYEVFKPLPEFRVAFRLIAGDGTVAFTSDDNNVEQWQKRRREVGLYRSTCRIPGDLLNEGRYSVTIKSDIPMIKNIISVEDAIVFTAERTQRYPNGVVEFLPGALHPVLPWLIEALPPTVLVPAAVVASVAGASRALQSSPMPQPTLRG